MSIVPAYNRHCARRNLNGLDLTSSRGKTPNTISRFLRKMEWFGFLWILVFLVWERGHSTVNSQCFLTMRPMIFWNLISISFYQTIIF